MQLRCRKAILAIAVLALTQAEPAAAQAGAESTEPVRTALPNDVSVELLGHSILYDFSYQRMVSPMIGLEASVAGLGSGSSSGDGSASLLFGSAGARLYFMQKDASPFVTGGGVFISASTDAGPLGSDHASTSYAYTGLGFEVRSRNGFLFRGTVYGLLAGGGYFIWPGLTLGYAF